MNREHTCDDVFEHHLTDWENRLERGEEIDQSESHAEADEEKKRLVCGLAWLKHLNNLRKRNLDTPACDSTHAGQVAIAATKHQLPARFGKFDLLNELGRGGFGVVFRARDRKLDCLVALKMPHSHVLTDAALRGRFLREARVAAGLQHPHIVSVHEAGEVGPVNYIVYAYCPGITLAEWLRKQKDQISAQQAAQWMISLAEAVAFAHSKGVLHRDLKPANILLYDPNATGNTTVTGIHQVASLVPKITDFGLAKLQREEHQTATGAILGTPTYMAPEQANSRGVVGPAVDIHALGVILYEMLAGHPPYRGENDYETLQMVSKLDPLPLRKLRPKLPRDLETICLKCLHKEPAMRYASAHALSEDLQRFLGGEPIQARAVTIVERAWRVCYRHPLVTVLATALFFTVMTGIAMVIYQSEQQGVQAEATQALLKRHIDFLMESIKSAQKMLEDPRTEKQGREKLISLLPNFETFLQQEQSVPSLQLQVAKLATQAGTIYQTLFDFKKAISKYHQADSLYEKYLQIQKRSPELLDEQMQVQLKLAYCYGNLGRCLEADTMHQHIIDRMQTILNSEPNNYKAHSIIASALVFNCGNLKALNRSQEIEQNLLNAKSHIGQALDSMPTDDKLMLNSANVIDELGLYCMNNKRMEEAEKHLQHALAIRQRLYDQSPDLPSTAMDLARSYWRLGVFSQRNNKWPEAEKYYTTSMEMNDQLMKEHPNEPKYAHNAAWDRVILCNLLEKLERYSDTERLFRESIAIRKKYVKELPQWEGNQYELVTLFFRLSSVLRAMEKLQDADEIYQEGLVLQEKLTTEFPQDVKFRELYTSRLQTIARQYENNQQSEKAADAYRRLMIAREKLVETYPEMINYKRDLDASYGKLAASYRKAKKWEQAADMVSRMVALHTQILECPDAKPQDTQSLALRYLAWSRDLIQLQNYSLAIEKLMESRRLFEQLQQQGLRLEQQEANYSNVLIQLGNVYLLKQQILQAHQVYLTALPLRERQYKADPSTNQQKSLAHCHFMLFQTFWYGRHDVVGTIKHYILCTLLDPNLTKQPMDVRMLIRIMWWYGGWGKR